MSDEPESISQEQYDTLIGKLNTVEGMLEKNGETVEKLTGDVESFKEVTEVLQKDVKTLQEVEPVEIPEGPTTDSIQKMIDETVTAVSDSQEKRIETLEKSPLFKGPADTEPAVPEKKIGILESVIKNAYPEAIQE